MKQLILPICIQGVILPGPLQAEAWFPDRVVMRLLVHWEISGNGSIAVSETDEMGCTGISSSFDVLVQVCTGVADVSATDMQIYPNPFRDQFFIQFEKNRPGMKVSLEVHDSPGNVLLTENVISGVPNLVSLKNILPGLYLVKLVFDNKTITKKLIVQ